MLEKILSPTGLYLESVENFSLDRPLNGYYGFNVSRTHQEPIDQLHAFIAAKRIQEHNLAEFGVKGFFIPFIAGVFEVLNQKDVSSAKRILGRNSMKEDAKRKLFEQIMGRYCIDGKIYLTRDLWNSDEYWTDFSAILNDFFTREGLMQDTLRFVNQHTIDGAVKVSELSGLIPFTKEVSKTVGDWPAAILYTPAEVAEALFFTTRGTNLKIGPATERTYDKYISTIMDILHLKQPTDLRSQRWAPKTVCPYIEKGGRHTKLRIFFDDTADSINKKLEHVPPQEYAFTVDEEAGVILNPLVEKMIYAVESARALGQSVSLGSIKLESGKDVIDYARKRKILELKRALPETAERYLIAPFR